MEKPDPKQERRTMLPSVFVVSWFQSLPSIICSIVFVFFVATFEYSNTEKCVGPGFRNALFGNGSGRCDMISSIGFSFTYAPVAIWYSAYQGDFIDGRKEGRGEYSKWKRFFNFPENRIAYVGGFHEERRYGFGHFEIYDGASYMGSWNNNSFTSSNGSLRYQRDPLSSLVMIYKGNVNQGLMEGQGNLSIESVQISGEWRSGVFKEIHVTKSNAPMFDATMIDPVRAEGKTADGKTFTFDGSILTYDDVKISRSNKHELHGIPGSLLDSFDVLQDLQEFQALFIKHQKMVEDYEFDSTVHFSKRHPKPIKYWY